MLRSLGEVGREFTQGTIRHQLTVIPDLAADCANELRSREPLMTRLPRGLMPAVSALERISRLFVRSSKQNGDTRWTTALMNA